MKEAVRRFGIAFRNAWHGFDPHATIAELRGKNLMCFCPLDQPCHADVLLELANAPVPSLVEENQTNE